MSAPAELVDPGPGPADRRRQDMAAEGTRANGTTQTSGMTQGPKPGRRRFGPLSRPRKAWLVAAVIAASLVPAACSGNSPGPGASPTTHPSPGHSSQVPTQPSGSPSPSASSPTPSPSASSSPSAKPASALAEAKSACPSLLSWDNFHRSNRSLHRDRLPTGQVYYASGPDNQEIVNDRFVPNTDDLGHGQEADLLYVWLRRVPITLAARFVFTPGQTSGQNAVIGVAPRHAVIGVRHMLGFGIGSVQLAIYPTYWQLFYIKNPDYKTYFITVATGQFKHPLRQDGHTTYDMALTYHPGKSAVTIQFPGGRRTFSNSYFADFWGRLYAIQMRRPHSTDGNGAFLVAGTASTACTTAQILGQTKHHH